MTRNASGFHLLDILPEVPDPRNKKGVAIDGNQELCGVEDTKTRYRTHLLSAITTPFRVTLSIARNMSSESSS